MRRTACLVVLAVALVACGDNKTGSDGSVVNDSGNPDAPSFPAPPMLGAQIDRMGRPAISTALVAVLASPGTAKTAQKDAYNRAPDAAAWRTTMLQTNVTIEREFERNLAVLDVLDLGLANPSGGCGSALRYGPPGTMAYRFAADLLADDQLYVDTSRATCSVYLALEVENASGSIPHMTCGGRMLAHDVIDVTYSVLTSGLADYDTGTNEFNPRIRDGVGVHPDIMDTFPFLGAPH